VARQGKVSIYQVAPNRWTNKPPRAPVARSRLPLPYVISDTMDPVEQVDGKFYTSKRAFRAVGRALGLTEVGNERPKPFKPKRSTKAERMAALQKAIAQYKSGRRPRGG